MKQRANLTVIFLILYLSVIVMACDNPSNDLKENKQDSTLAGTVSSLSVDTTIRKKIYLTFDDGPGKGTSNVLQIAEDEKALATFFIIGEHVFASRAQIHEWAALKANRYIELCNHGYTHAWHNNYNGFYLNPDSVVTDFKRTKDSLGFTNNIARTPGRNIWRIGNLRKTDKQNSMAAADSLQKAGFILAGWDLEWRFNRKSLHVTITADSLIKRIDSLFANNRTRKAGNLVLLAHDRIFRKSYDSAQLRQLFQKLKIRNEYELSWVTDYPDND